MYKRFQIYDNKTPEQNPKDNAEGEMFSYAKVDKNLSCRSEIGAIRW